MKERKSIFKTDKAFVKASEITTRTEWRRLHEMLEAGTATKVKRGLYRLKEIDTDIQLLEIAKSFPYAVMCMFTAWQYYALSTYQPYEFHIAVANNKAVKRPDYPPVKVYYLTERIFALGITDIIVQGENVKMYDLEKSVCDAVKFRNKVGLDTTIEVLKAYVKRKDRDLNRLSAYAKTMRIEKKLSDMIMPLL